MTFYLFPGEIYRRYKRSAYSYNSEFTQYNASKKPNLRAAYEVYHLAVKQYLGFGGLLQFIPRTNANLARRHLTNKLDTYINDDYMQHKGRPLSRFYFNFMNINLFYERLKNRKSRYQLEIAKNYKESLGSKIKKLLEDLPILNLFDIDLEYEPIMSIIECFNPISIIQKFSCNLRQVLFSIFDIGSEEHSESSLPRALIKGIIALPFFILETALSAVELTISAITFPVRQLFSHFADSFKQALQYHNKYRNNGIVIATVKDLREARQLRRAVKRAKDNSYTKHESYEKITIDTSSSVYIGTTKQHLYSTGKGLDENTPVAIIRRTEAQAKNTRMLVSVVGKFKNTSTAVHEDSRAIEEASKKYITITP